MQFQPTWNKVQSLWSRFSNNFPLLPSPLFDVTNIPAFSGETSIKAPLLGCAKSHFLAPTARNLTSAPVNGGTWPTFLGQNCTCWDEKIQRQRLNTSWINLHMFLPYLKKCFEDRIKIAGAHKWSTAISLSWYLKATLRRWCELKMLLFLLCPFISFTCFLHLQQAPWWTSIT